MLSKIFKELFLILIRMEIVKVIFEKSFEIFTPCCHCCYDCGNEQKNW